MSELVRNGNSTYRHCVFKKIIMQAIIKWLNLKYPKNYSFSQHIIILIKILLNLMKNSLFINRLNYPIINSEIYKTLINHNLVSKIIDK